MARSRASIASASAGLFVIIAQEMQKAVHDQMSGMVIEAFALNFRFRSNGFGRQRDIAEEAWSAALPALAETKARWWGRPCRGIAGSARRLRRHRPAAAKPSRICPPLRRPRRARLQAHLRAPATTPSPRRFQPPAVASDTAALIAVIGLDDLRHEAVTHHILSDEADHFDASDILKNTDGVREP